MQEEGASTILTLVEQATEVLSHAADDTCRISPADTATLSQVLKKLQRLVTDLASQRVLELSGTQLMNAGVELYNAPRAALRVLAQIEKAKSREREQFTIFPRHSLAVTRFVAAKVMGLSLVCSSKDGRVQESDGKKSMQFMDECVDVLRSFGRVGMLMLESASIDCEKCEEYLVLAKESFTSSLRLWSRIGLSHLTKLKQGVELEDVVDDLWDFCVDRVRVLRLMLERSDNLSDEYQEIVSSLHELKMLAPYKTSYASSLLGVMKNVSDGYAQVAQHELQVAFAEEALRVGESLESNDDESFPELLSSFKQHVMLNLLRSLCATDDIERAEKCYQLIPHHWDPEVLLLMVRLYVGNQKFDQANRSLILLFQLDNLENAILGARIYARALSFSSKGMDIYRELAENYDGADFIINVEIACNLAFDEDKRYEAMAELKRIGIDLAERERYGSSILTGEYTPTSYIAYVWHRDGQVADREHLQRIQRTIFDALQHALNANQHEDCLKWADAGLAAASTAQEKATFMRIMSRSCLDLGRDSEALDWAEKALAVEPSKQSLFAVFQGALNAKTDALVHIVEQLKGRNDFEIGDLFAIGKLASGFGPSRQDIVMHIVDEMCSTLTETDNCPTKISAGIVLQNAAQLAFSRLTQQQTESTGDSTSSYSEKFLGYANALLQQSKPGTPDLMVRSGPSSVFEWFYRMSFDIAKATEDSRYFVVAADIAERSDELYGEKSPLQRESHRCLLAAVSSDMKNIETLDSNQLVQLLEVIERFQNIPSDAAPDVMTYLAKATVVAKVRLLDANTKAMLDLCMTTLHNAADLEEIGELVLYAAKFDEASKVRDSYQALAREIFNHGLQLLVRANPIDPSSLCYLLRRLVMLAESKSKAHEYFDQLLEFISKLDLVFSELEMEWFVSKAWNIGVLSYRSNDSDDALKFMKVAQAIMHHSEPLVEKLGNELDKQYQEVLRMNAKSTIGDQ